MPSGLYLSKTGPRDSVTDFARMIYDNKPHNLRSVREAEEVFRHNNAIRSGLSPWSVVNLNPFPLSSAAFDQWQTNQHAVSAKLNANPGLFDFLLTTTYEEQLMMLNFAETAEKSGWTVGKKEVIDAAGYTLSGASGAFAAEQKSLAEIQKLAKELMEEAVKKHGKDILQKKSIKKLEEFLKNNPKYHALQNRISELSKFVSRDMGRLHPTPGATYPNARFMRRQIILPFFNPQRYCDAFETLLKSKIIRFGRFGAAATWYLPAAVGLYSVYDAPP